MRTSSQNRNRGLNMMRSTEAAQELFQNLLDAAQVNGVVLNGITIPIGGGGGSDEYGFPEETASLLGRLSSQVFHALKAKEPSWPAAVLSVLAEATKAEPSWRRRFGLGKRVVPRDDGLPHDSEPDCVLEVARFIIATDECSRHSHLLQPALKLTANCCADDNTNRSLFVHRHGISSLKRLVLQKRELDILLPTMFNVCTDYDEVAMDANGNPMRIDDQMGESSDITVTEMQLAEYVDFPEGQMSSIEMWSQIPEQFEGFLGYLFDLSTRPALYTGIDAVSAATSTILDKTRMICALLTRIQDFKTLEDAEENSEVRFSLHSACLNLLSSPSAKLLLAQSPKTLWRFVQLYWDMESTESTKPFEEAFLKIIYSVTELSEYPETITIGSDAFGALVNHYNLIAADQASNRQIQSTTVLLVNALTSPDRLEQALARFPDLPQTTAAILTQAMYYAHKLPILDLATRLAINPTGQRSLLTTNIVEHLNHALLYTIPPQTPSDTTANTAPSSTNTTGQNFLPFQRLAIPLARYLMKSQPLRQLPAPFTQLHNTILHLSSTTIDATTKRECAVYCLEVLRCRRTTSTFASSTATTSAVPSASARSGDVDIDITDPRFVAGVLSLLPSPASSPASSALASASASTTNTALGIFALALLLSQVECVGSLHVQPIVEVARGVVLPILRDRDGGRSREEEDNLRAAVAGLLRILAEEEGEMREEMGRFLRGEI